MEPAIRIERDPDEDTLRRLGVFDWPIWTKEASRFPWSYGESETCYLLEGDVTVTPDGGNPVRFGEGDLVTFATGLSCTWEIHKSVRKHYTFG